MAVVIVHQTQLSIIVLAAPLDRLPAVTAFRYTTVRRVVVGGADVAGGAEDFADVFGEVPAVGVPGAVFADGKGARGDGLSGVPRDEPERGVGGAGEVTTGDLQVAAVNVALVEGDAAVGGYLLGGAAAHGVIAALDDGGAIGTGEAHGAVLGVVLHAPDAGGGLHRGLVAICIEGGGEIAHDGVLIQLIGRVRRHFLTLGGCVSIADVVVGVAVGAAVDCGAGKFAAGVVHEAVVYRPAVAGGAAGERATERVVAVAALHHFRIAAAVGHADEQVALRFVALRERHVAGHGERVQQVGAGQVAVAKLLFGTTMQEAGAIDAPVGTVAGGDGVLHRAVLGVGEAGGAPHRIARLGG